MTEKTTTGDTSKLMALVPLSRFNDYYDFPSVGALRQLNFFNTHGFSDRVVRRIAKRLYIKISALQEWIEETGNGRVA